jgi:electron transfer flavoprotein alpha subunit
MIEKIMLLTHTEADGSLAKPAREALTAAIDLHKSVAGSTLSVGLWGEDVQTAADCVAACGAATFHAVSGPEFAVGRYASDAAAATALIGAAAASVVIAPTTSRLSRALPGTASRVGGRIDTHVAAIEPEDDRLKIRRWYYRQRMVATLSRSHRPWLIAVDSGVFEPWSGESGSATAQLVVVDLPDRCRRTRVEGVAAAAADAQTIRPDADLLFVTGAGWTKRQKDGQTHLKEAEKLILGFLDATRASLGGSKSLVDQSGEGEAVLTFMTHLNQVGQTGSTPRHPKGLATCCHGEEPHVVGWRFVNERRAVNTDPGCGWARGKADVLYVADAFEVMARVNELLGQDS